MFGDVGVGIATGFVVIILLVFGEIGPKIYASRASDSFALAVAPVSSSSPNCSARLSGSWNG